MSFVKIDQHILEEIIQEIGKAPIETGLGDLYKDLNEILDEHLDEIDTEELKQKPAPAVKKSAPTASAPATAKLQPLAMAREFVKNNPTASVENVKNYLVDAHVSPKTASSTAHKVFKK